MPLTDDEYKQKLTDEIADLLKTRSDAVSKRAAAEQAKRDVDAAKDKATAAEIAAQAAESDNAKELDYFVSLVRESFDIDDPTPPAPPAEPVASA